MSDGWGTTPMPPGTLQANYKLGMPPLSGQYIPEIPAAGFPPTINYGAAQMSTTQGVPFSPLAISLKNQQNQQAQMQQFLNALDKDMTLTAMDTGPDFSSYNAKTGEEEEEPEPEPAPAKENPSGEEQGQGTDETLQTSGENNPQPDKGQSGTAKKEVTPRGADTGPHRQNAMWL